MKPRFLKTFQLLIIIDIESLKNRLLKVCYVPATSAGLPRVSFFFSFLFFVAATIDCTNDANKVPLSSLYSLDVYANNTQAVFAILIPKHLRTSITASR